MSYDSDLSFNYLGPTKVVFGAGLVSELPMEIAELGKKAVLVTDEGIIKAGLIDIVKEKMGDKLAGIFSDVPQDTGMDVVDKGAEYAKSVGADVVVSVGGGSAIDTGKGMCIVMKEEESMRSFQGMQVLTRPQTPHIVVPTTAGTGSEVTAGMVILDREQGQKIIMFENYNIPRVAILDPVMTEKLPPNLTASTGMDALTHAVESYVSVQRNPISDAVALHGVRLVSRHLAAAVKNGSDLVARGQMQVAALLSGWAFSNALLGLVHAMAHSIGAVKGVPHGLANGILLPHVMRFNTEEVPELLADIAEAMGVDTRDKAPKDAAEAGVGRLEELMDEIGHPRKLSEVGVTEEDIKVSAELAMSDGSIVYNPRMIFDQEEVLSVFKDAF
jgi:alcohol dehydrogenase